MGVLKSCPFCGGEARFATKTLDNTVNVWITCKKCDAATTIFSSDASKFPRRLEASSPVFKPVIERWNRRAEEKKPEPPVERWISVNDELPKVPGSYLVCGDGKRWICDFMSLDSHSGWVNDAENPRVEAWMPLPSPFRGRR